MTTENKKDYFGEFGGSYAPEVVQKALDELELAYNKYKDDEEFFKRISSLLIYFLLICDFLTFPLYLTLLYRLYRGY